MIKDEEFNSIALALEDYHGIFSKIWQMGKPVSATEVRGKPLATAAILFDRIGGFFQFLFNPDFYASIDDYNRKFIICHESLHVILNHGYRSYGMNPEIANFAMDIVINESLVSNFGFDRNKIKNWEKYCWYDTVFTPEDNIQKNKSFEYYYELLFNKIMNDDSIKKITIDLHLGFGSDCQSQIDDILDNICGDLTQEEQKQLKELIKKLLDKESQDKLAGNAPGGLKQIMNVSNVAKKQKWETVIKRWMTNTLMAAEKEITQFTRTNRRFVTLPKNMLLPTDIIDEGIYDEKHRIKVLFFLDTSGSCAHLAQRFFNAAKSLPKRSFDVQLFCFDTQIYETSLKTGELFGFGGTAFDIIEEYVQKYTKEKNDGKYPDACFVVTDGVGNLVKPQYPKKWFWFLSEDNRTCIPKECNIYKLSDYE